MRKIKLYCKNAMNAVERGENTEMSIKPKGKLLIVKFKGITTREAMDEMHERVSKQVKSGVVVLDDKVKYEVI